MSIKYENTVIEDVMLEGEFGLEKESLRVDEKGYLSMTKHPFSENPHIERDFSESQVELITDVFYSIDDLYNQLSELHREVIWKLWNMDSGTEYLWAFSNPPYIGQDGAIPIAKYKGELKGKEKYREYLGEKYGRRKMLLSGIHINFSFPETMLKRGYETSGADSFQTYKNKTYLELAKRVLEYDWLIVYLTAASPVLDGSYEKKEKLGKELPVQYASVRCSEDGYWNPFVPILQYESLDSYIASIQKYVDIGQLKSTSELYYPVRLKPKGENSLARLKEQGVNHIELRMLDVNPLSPVGIMKADLEFLHLLLVYLSSLKDTELGEAAQLRAIANAKQSALFEEKAIFVEDSKGKKHSIKEAAVQVLCDMEQFYWKHGKESAINKIVYQKNKIVNPANRYANQIQERFGTQYVENGLELAKQYAKGQGIYSDFAMAN